MNYIQNKLDFEHFLMDKFPFHSNNSNEAFEKWLVDMDIDAILNYADEYKNKSLTDYHNHIVEKIDKMLDDLHTENCDEDKSFAFKKKGTAGQVGYEIGIADMKVKIGSLLQDTNTKE